MLCFKMGSTFLKPKYYIMSSNAEGVIRSLKHSVKFKNTLNKIPNETNNMKNKRTIRQKNTLVKNLTVLSRHGHQNPYNMITILRHTRIEQLVYRIQQRYQNIMNAVIKKHNVANPPYDDEICLFVLAHGKDTMPVNKKINDENLFNNVRIFGLKDTNTLFQSTMGISSIYDGKIIKLLHNYEKNYK